MEQKIIKCLNTMNDVLDHWINNQPENLTCAYINGFSEINFNNITVFSSQKIYNEAEKVLQKYNSIQNKNLGTKIIFYNHSILGETMLLLNYNNEENEWQIDNGWKNGEPATVGKLYPLPKKTDSFLPYVSNYDVLRPDFIEKFCNNILTIPKENNQPAKFKSNYSDESLTKIMQLLVSKKQLAETDLDLWLYWFNRNTKYETPIQMDWIGTATMAANVFSTICETYQTVAAKAAFKDIKITSVSIPKDRPNTLLKRINGIIVIDKQNK